MKKLKFLPLLLCGLLLLGLTVSAYAEPTNGSLKVTILETSTGKGIRGATVSIYPVARVDGVQYVLNDIFSKSGFDVSTIGTMSASESAAAAARLLAFVKEAAIAPASTRITNEAGVVQFGTLPLGLYLVMELSPAGHTNIAPFLITVPQRINGELEYNVDAAPKTGTSASIPTIPPTRPTIPVGPGLPQTGQLWWPVYVMAGAGLLLFVIGWIRRRSGSNV